MLSDLIPLILVKRIPLVIWIDAVGPPSTVTLREAPLFSWLAIILTASSLLEVILICLASTMSVRMKKILTMLDNFIV